MVLVIFLLYLTKFDLVSNFLGHYPAAVLVSSVSKSKGLCGAHQSATLIALDWRQPPAGVRREILFFLIKIFFKLHLLK